MFDFTNASRQHLSERYHRTKETPECEEHIAARDELARRAIEAKRKTVPLGQEQQPGFTSDGAYAMHPRTVTIRSIDMRQSGDLSKFFED